MESHWRSEADKQSSGSRKGGKLTLKGGKLTLNPGLGVLRKAGGQRPEARQNLITRHTGKM